MTRQEALARIALALDNAVRHAEAILYAVLLGLRQVSIVAYLNYLITLLTVIQLAAQAVIDETDGEQ